MNTPTPLPTGIWTLDTSATTVTISAEMLGFLTVPATLTVSSGTIEVDENHAVTSIDIVADAASYTSKNPKRNEHVVGPDFLDSAQHPTIEFRASKVTPGSADYTTSATVTAKGRSAPIHVTISDVDIVGDRGSFTATATVDRHTIGVDKMPGFIIGRDLQLSVTASATRSE